MLTPSRFTALFLLAGTLAFAQNAPVPSAYQSLFNLLQNQLNGYNTSVAAQLNPGSSSVAWGGELSTANSNRGLQVLTPQALSGTMLELDRLQALGVKSVTVPLGFPILYQPFYQFNGDPNDYQAVLNYYRQVASAVHSRGLKLVVESQLLFPGIYTQNSGLNLADYYKTLSDSDLTAGRVQNMMTIAREIQPDFLNLGSEPDTLAAIRGTTQLTAAQYGSLVNSMASQLKGSGVTIPLGAGIGTWQRNGANYVQAICSSGVDYLDLHVYLINAAFLTNVATYSDMALGCGKKVGISEAWMTKESDSEIGTVDAVNDPMAFARDAFGFWAPLDQLFLTNLVKTAQAKQMLYLSPFWTKYFWSYLDYGSYQSLDLTSTQSSQQVVAASNQAAAAALQAGQVTSTGAAYKNAIGGAAGPQQVTAASAASFLSGNVAPDSIVSLFGLGLASGTASATALPLPGNLAGTTVSVRDSAGNTQQVPLYFASPQQINAQIPAGLALGSATVTVSSGGNQVAQTNVNLTAVAPGLFAANSAGNGVVAGIVVVLHSDGTQTFDSPFQCSSTPGSCTSKPISLGSASDQVALEIFGTGIRGNSGLSSVQVVIGGVSVPVTFAGAQGQYPGLDQVNLNLPRSLAGVGEVNLNLVVNGVNANAVRVAVASN